MLKYYTRKVSVPQGCAVTGVAPWGSGGDLLEDTL